MRKPVCGLCYKKYGRLRRLPTRKEKIRICGQCHEEYMNSEEFEQYAQTIRNRKKQK